MVSGQNVSAASQANLNPIAAFEKQQMATGLSPAVQQQALQQNTQQNEQGINNTLANATPGSNTLGLAEDLQKQAIMGNAQVSSNLAAANQSAEQAGAAGLQQTNALLNPNQSYETGAQSSTSSSQGTQNTTSNPGFGSFLGSLLGGVGGAMTGGAAGAGGLGAILGGL
jgi:hypothetical protein